ncbi:MAG: hypothetical protein ACI9WO_002035 [Sphingobacteriales bacterium]
MIVEMIGLLSPFNSEMADNLTIPVDSMFSVLFCSKANEYDEMSKSLNHGIFQQKR